MPPKKTNGRSKANSQASRKKTKKTTAANPTGVSKTKKAVAPKPSGARKTASRARPSSRADEPRRSRRLQELNREQGDLGAEPLHNAPQAAAPDHGPIASAGDHLLNIIETTPEQMREDISYGPGDTEQAQLIGQIVVSNDAEKPSREQYMANFFLKRAADDKQVPVCEIKSWRIDRSTEQWQKDFIRVDFESLEASDSAYETTLCMQGLFKSDGTVQHTAKLRTRLRDAQVVFIEMIVVEEDFRRQGLLSPILKLFRRMLREQKAFDGVVVLIPSRPEGTNGAIWEGKTDTKVEDSLKKAYSKRDGFATLRVKAIVGAGDHGRIVPIMGRAVEG